MGYCKAIRIPRQASADRGTEGSFDFVFPAHPRRKNSAQDDNGFGIHLPFV